MVFTCECFSVRRSSVPVIQWKWKQWHSWSHCDCIVQETPVLRIFTLRMVNKPKSHLPIRPAAVTGQPCLLATHPNLPTTMKLDPHCHRYQNSQAKLLHYQNLEPSKTSRGTNKWMIIKSSFGWFKIFKKRYIYIYDSIYKIWYNISYKIKYKIRYKIILKIRYKIRYNIMSYYHF